MRSRHKLPGFRIAVVGAGAIGLYYGGKLAQFGRDVHFLLRSDYESVRRRGLRIRSREEKIHVPKVRAYRSTGEIGPCDLVIVAVKTTSNPDLPPLILPLLGEKTMILTFQNGLGNEEFLARHFDAGRIMGGLCYICLNRVGPGVVERFGAARLAIGEFASLPKPRTHDVSWEFKRCGVVCSVVADLALERWRKLVWNVAFNGLTITAGGIDTAALLADDGLRLEALELMNEIIGIASACGQKLPTILALDYLKRTAAMGPYRPSTLLDYEAGRPLEIDAIWGEALRRGRAVGASVPRLEQLYARLRDLNQGGKK
jgi:2-dehydropantoate 2-reductase